MAEALLSIAAKKVAEVVGRELSLYAGARGELVKLRDTSESIQALLADAERRQAEDESVKLWLSRVRGVAYDIDDLLLDDLLVSGHEVAEEERDDDDYWVISGFVDWVRACWLSPFTALDHIGSCLPTPLGHVASRYMIACRITEIRKRLDHVDGEKNRYSFSSSSGDGQGQLISKRPYTGSLIEEVMIGRDQDKAEIIKRLECGSSSENGQVQVIAIVGIAGLGKTTLAREIYNDSSLCEYFDLFSWACVTEVFNVAKVIKAILHDLKENTTTDELSPLQKQLRDQLDKKRFLVVLDDVWNEDEEKWSTLRASFKSGATGSRILVTTRTRKVAETMDAVCIHELEGLSDVDSWRLFSNRAFTGGDDKDHSDFKVVGTKIVSKCKGVPLLIKVMGSVVKGKTSVEDCEKISESKMWSLPDAKSKILPALWLSYHNLPPHLKPCFAYCSIFPKDTVMKKDRLVKLWVAQGFVHAQGNREVENIAAEYFDDLLGWSMFQEASDDRSRCKMHDLLHDLAEYVTKDETYVYVGEKPNQCPTNVRHASFVFSENDLNTNLISLCGAKTLRTLFLRSYDRIDTSLDNIFLHARFLRALDFKFAEIRTLPRTIGNLKHLRYLDLSQSLIMELPNVIEKMKYLKYLNLRNSNLFELPNAIGNLKHLTYLNLRDLKIVELPDSLTHLRNLHTLKLNGCFELKKLPTNMGGMVGLRHLEIEDTCLEHLPKGMGRMTSLKSLCKFIVGGEGGCEINELQQLNCLQGNLTIEHLERVPSRQEAMKAELWKKQHLHKLVLKMSSDSDEEIVMLSNRSDSDEEVAMSSDRSDRDEEVVMLSDRSDRDEEVAMLSARSERDEEIVMLSDRSDSDEEVAMLSDRSDRDEEVVMLSDSSERDEEVAMLSARSERDEEIVMLSDRSDSDEEVAMLSDRYDRDVEVAMLSDRSDRDEEVAMLSDRSNKDKEVAILSDRLDRDEEVANSGKHDAKEWMDEQLVLEMSSNRGEEVGTSGRYDADSVLEGLRPHENLNELKLVCNRRSSKLPSWLEDSSFVKLTKLKIEGVVIGCEQNNLAGLGKLPALKYLKMRNVDVKKLGHEWYYGNSSNDVVATGIKTVFPKLEQLELLQMHELEEWILEFDEDVNIMPHLSDLRLLHCPELKGLPHHLVNAPLKNLELAYCERLEGIGCSSSFPFLENFTLNDSSEFLSSGLPHFPKLKEFFIIRVTDEILPNEGWECLLVLRKLSIDSCLELKSLPDGLTQLSSLEYLTIDNCSEIKSLPEGLGQLKKLRSLKFNSSELFTYQPDLLGQLESLEDLDINQLRKLRSLLKGLEQLEKLKSLGISCTEVSSCLPNSLAQPESLEELNLELLPEEIRELNKLKSLIISFEEVLSCLPNSLAQLESLEELHINSLKKLESLPEEIGNLKKLKSLKICHAEALICLPNSLTQLESLEQLEIIYLKKLESLPEEIGKLKKLKSLEIYHAKALIRLPNSLAQLESLEQLCISGLKKLESLPEGLEQLKKLMSVIIYNAEALSCLPDSLALLESLEQLYIGGLKKLEFLPERFGQLKKLKSLEISDAKELTCLPNSLGQLESLEHFKIVGLPKLESLPHSLVQLKKLETLVIAEMEGLINIPESFRELELLKDLTISHCGKLKSLPHSFGQLKSLTLRHLQARTCLPNTLEQLKSLHKLHISGWKELKSLPPWLVQLKALRTLELVDCIALSSLPLWLKGLPLLKELIIQNCPQLSEWYKKEGGYNLPKILQIPYIKIS